MYKAQGKFSLALGLTGNAGVQCAQARQGEKRVPDSFNPTSGQSTGNFSLTLQDRKGSKKGAPQNDRQVFVAEDSHASLIALSIPVWVLPLTLIGKSTMEIHM